ncbi:MAG: glycoside hydrolase 43 family protein, partial [Roseibium sp.]
LPPHPFEPEPDRHDFDEPDLPMAFQWLRSPRPERLFSLSERPGHLRLFGRESIGSYFEQALVARRQTDFNYVAETSVDFQPKTSQQTAGLIAYYGRYQFFQLAICQDETPGRCLTIMACPGDYPAGNLSFPLDAPVPLETDGPVRMKIEVKDLALRFFYTEGGADWRRIGPIFDASLLSDEAGKGEHGNFTGAFVGMQAMDGSGTGHPADFDFFTYTRMP